MRKPYALVTGSTSGIGLEIAHNLGKRGFNLILTARRKVLLKTISIKISKKYNVKVDYICGDLSLKETPNKIFEYCDLKKYDINILINNAGYGIVAPLHKSSMEDEEKCIRVLSISVIALTKLFLNKMMKKGDGKIMIVSSVAAFAPPSAVQSLYGPTKTFVNRFSELINLNYNKYGIYSTAVCPGYTITNFHTASGVQDEMNRVPTFLKSSAFRVASESVDAMFKRKHLYVPTKRWKIIAFLLKTVPRPIFKILSSIIAPGRFEK
ncbi:MAG: polyketide synthase [Flavobacteriaceae bacterium]|nr:polyketide synthase [Flavobacteriaceae bacterium]|tara:strand:- start:1066 stop:1863 length:798 start_codon:yes stop_codon:yes gene_type:complete